MLQVKIKDSLGIVKNVCFTSVFSENNDIGLGGNGDDCKQTGITPQKGKQEALWKEDDLPIHNLERTGFCRKNS